MHRKGRQCGDTEGEDGPVTVQPRDWTCTPVKKYQGLQIPGARRDKKESPPNPSEEPGLADTLILDFKPPDL